MDAERVLAVAAPCLCERGEHGLRAATRAVGSGFGQRALAARIWCEDARPRHRIVGPRFDGIRKRRCIQACILARVESRQMEAERADAPEQAPHREPARMHAGVLAQAATDAFDVFGQFRGIGITLGGVVRARREPRADEVQQVAVRHVGVARTDLRRGLRQQRAVRVEAFEHRRGYAHAVERLREQPRELRAFGAVALDDDVPLPAQRRRDGRGVRVRIAVHVAAGPVGEAQQPRQGRAGAVDVDDGAFERFVERRHDAVDRVGEVEVDMFELVEHARSLAGDVGGLPGAGQRHAQARPIDLALGRGARADQIGDQRTHDLLLLLEQDAPRHFGRMRGEHGFDVDARQRGEQDVRADAGLAQAQQRRAGRRVAAMHRRSGNCAGAGCAARARRC
jgi:hypothetical protein